MSTTHCWRYFLSPPDAWEAMYQDCVEATRSIEIEQYIIEDDVVGQRFMALFMKKAAQGLKIFVILDTFGSRSFHNSEVIQQLRQKGGVVYFYNNITWLDLLRPWRWFPRTHIKTLLVDSVIAYTGGVCLAARMTKWRDTQIRITGHIVEQVSRDFARIEKLAKKNKLAPVSHSPIHLPGPFVYMESYPFVSWHLIYHELLKAIGRATKFIYISTPFFAPNRRFRLLLQQAAKRGVDVRLLVPEHSDFNLADWLCLSYAPMLLKNGARIFRYTDSVLHQKTIVIDDSWGTIGSTNMDILSFFRNREANLFITNVDAVAELKQHFFGDLLRSTELTKDWIDHEAIWKVVIGYLCRLPKTFLWRT